MLLVDSLVLVACDEGSKRVFEDAGSQDVQHDLYMLEWLARFEHYEHEVPSHRPPKAFDILVSPLASACDEIQDVETFFNINSSLQLSWRSPPKALETRYCVDIGSYLCQGNKGISQWTRCARNILQKDEFYKV